MNPRQSATTWQSGLAALLVLAIILGGNSGWSVADAGLAVLSVLAIVLALGMPGGQFAARPAWAVWLMVVFGLVVLHCIPMLPFPWMLPMERGVMPPVGIEDLPAGRMRPYSLDPWRALQSAGAFLVPLAVAALSIRAEFRGWATRIAWLLVVVVAVMGLAGLLRLLPELIWGSASGSSALRTGAVGLFSNPNAFGGLMAMVMPLAWVLWMDARFRAYTWTASSVTAASCLLVQGMGLLASGSRGAVLGGAVAMATLAFSERRALVSAFKRSTLLMAAASGVLAAVLLFRWRGAISLLAEQASPGGRLDLLAGLGQLPVDVGFGGVGLGAFSAAYAATPGNSITDAYVNHLHNDWIEVALELGVPGMVLMGGFLIMVGLDRWQVRFRAFEQSSDDRIARGCFAGGCAIFVHSLIDFPLRSTANAATLAALISLLAIIAGRRRAGSQQPSWRPHHA